MRLLISDEQNEAAIGKETRRLIREALDEVLASEPFGPVRQALAGREVEVSLALVDDARMAALNRQYRGLDGTTDVLSFPMDELEVGACPSPLASQNELLLGDIVISVPKAISQAAAYGNSLQQEMVWLAVHGMLHLLGYDDKAGLDALRMMERSRQVMDKLGLGENPEANPDV